MHHRSKEPGPATLQDLEYSRKEILSWLQHAHMIQKNFGIEASLGPLRTFTLTHFFPDTSALLPALPTFYLCHIQNTCFFRRWNPLVVAGGGGGAGQCSPGQDALLAEYGLPLFLFLSVAANCFVFNAQCFKDCAGKGMMLPHAGSRSQVISCHMIGCVLFCRHWCQPS